ncbi:2-methoxy-6-polyprenyl-1,4-benzoquinol methylase, mitochondrial [Vibrio stylophorae]|uniref:2-methoxy-6-polyprenyl-1,4-benzoquinol methylase, mitochondrial n=1 Tax=Vibrio stylophorae TaxID=659351 RepID=A0ABM8ZXT9_9VIBR|nr:class I SAM-dependent methyltransferase [Vibrio stylophorae]CAH0535576.1 2-methoxy-6-polyprenyl-1,4-benzoquinol methylase, mitochondrial [Vibrio stylophorae]
MFHRSRAYATPTQQDQAQQYSDVVSEADIERIKMRLAALTKLGCLLEVGCGQGTYTQVVLPATCEVYATDISEDMVAVSRQRFEQDGKVTVEKVDCLALPYEDASMDSVLMVNLIHIIATPERAIAEAFRVLKPGGRLIIASYTEHQMTLWQRFLLKQRNRKYQMKRSMYHRVMSPVIAQQLTSRAGFISPYSEMLGYQVKTLFHIAEKPQSVRKVKPVTVKAMSAQPANPELA